MHGWHFLDILRTFGNIWVHLRTFEHIWGYLGTFGDIWGYLGTCGDMWGHLGTCRDIWEHVGTYGNMWGHVRGHVGTYGNMWGHWADIRSMKFLSKIRNWRNARRRRRRRKKLILRPLRCTWSKTFQACFRWFIKVLIYGKEWFSVMAKYVTFDLHLSFFLISNLISESAMMRFQP